FEFQRPSQSHVGSSRRETNSAGSAAKASIPYSVVRIPYSVRAERGRSDAALTEYGIRNTNYGIRKEKKRAIHRPPSGSVRSRSQVASTHNHVRRVPQHPGFRQCAFECDQSILLLSLRRTAGRRL